MMNRISKTGTFSRLLGLAFATMLILSVNSCEQYEIKPPDEVGEVTFSGTIQPIFTSKCAGCHNGVVHPLNLTEGSAYNAMLSYTPEQGGSTINTDAPEESVIYIMALDGAHGFFNLSATQKAQILQWLEGGALND